MARISLSGCLAALVLLGWQLPVLMTDETVASAQDAQLVGGKSFISETVAGKRVGYVVLAPSVLRPGAIYRVLVDVRSVSATAAAAAAGGGDGGDGPTQRDVDIGGALLRNGAQLASARATVRANHAHLLLLQVPQDATAGEYTVRVEGNEVGFVGGSLFVRESRVQFSSNFLTILIETSRPVYTGDQTVRFRAILLNLALKPHDDSVTVYVHDPDGLVMRRWVSWPSVNGIVSLSFQLPHLAKRGEWTVSVHVRDQVQQQRIVVEKYYAPRYEVDIDMPLHFLSTERYISGAVQARFTYTSQPARGLLTLQLQYRRGHHSAADRNTSFVSITGNITTVIEGQFRFRFPMADLLAEAGLAAGLEVRVMGHMREFFEGGEQTGHCVSRVLDASGVRVQFVGGRPMVYRPGMPFSVVVSVSYENGLPLPTERLRASSLVFSGTAVASTNGELQWRLAVPRAQPLQYQLHLLQPTSNSNSSLFYDLALDQLYSEYRQSGLYRLQITAPSTGGPLELTARYEDDAGETTVASLSLVPHRGSSSGLLLQVESSTRRPQVGQYAIVHVRSNTPLDRFVYVVMSKGLLLHAAEEQLVLNRRTAPSSLVHTISVPVSGEMAPLFHVLVYHVTGDGGGEVVSDSVSLPVDTVGNGSGSADLVINQRKDRLKSTVEMVCGGVPGAFFGLSSLQSHCHLVATARGTRLSAAGVQRALLSFDNSSRWLHSVTRRDEHASSADSVTQYLVSPSYGANAAATLQLAQLVVLTDALLPNNNNNNNSSSGLCDNLATSSAAAAVCADPAGCGGYCGDVTADVTANHHDDQSDTAHFLLYRKNRLYSLFDEHQGDWAWKDLYIGYKSREELVLEVPQRQALYHVSGFTVSQTGGFAIIQQPLLYNTSRPFQLMVESVSRCRRGEQVSLRTVLTNNGQLQLLAMLQLPASSHYRVLPVTSDAREMRYLKPHQLSIGVHQHLVALRPHSSMQIDVPISLLVESGAVNVTVTAYCSLGSQTLTRTIVVEPEGVTIDLHTSLLLNLRDRADEVHFLDLMLDRNPEIAYQLERRFVYGSPRAHLTVTGGVVGPVVFTDTAGEQQQLHSEQQLGGERVRMRSAADSALSFGARLWRLHYLRLTRLLAPQVARGALERINVDMAAMLYQCRADGACAMWRGEQPSVWLTSWVVRLLDEARFQDWDRWLYVPSDVTARSVSWLLQHQLPTSGAFFETDAFSRRPLDTKLQPSDSSPSVSLTAQMLITLVRSLDSLEGQLRSRAIDAKVMATRYLERQLAALTRPYDIAVTTYALILANSGEAAAAFAKLQSIKRQQDNMIYWSPQAIDTNKMSNEVSQRDLLQPKIPQLFDSTAVEATSYALLCYLVRDSVSSDQQHVVLWLSSMRAADTGFASSTASLLALRALTEYSDQARVRDITDLRLSVKWSAAPRRERRLHLTNTSLAHTHRIDIGAVWGHVQLKGQGSGQALAQLHIAYGVDSWSRLLRPARPFFRLDISEQYHSYRNKSLGTVYVCLRWLYTEGSAASGATVLDVELPSGYVLPQSEADSVVSNTRRADGATVRYGLGSDAFRQERSTVWYFDSVPSDRDMCLNYTIRRWMAVSNMTRVRRAMVYEQYQPEHFQMEMVNSTVLYLLNVCEVCGSYQCAYCPFYSRTAMVLPSISLVAFALVVCSFIARWRS